MITHIDLDGDGGPIDRSRSRTGLMLLGVVLAMLVTTAVVVAPRPPSHKASSHSTTPVGELLSSCLPDPWSNDQGMRQPDDAYSSRDECKVFDRIGP